MLVYFISFVHFLLFALLKEIQKWEEKKLITNPQKKMKKIKSFLLFLFFMDENVDEDDDGGVMSAYYICIIQLNVSSSSLFKRHF